MTPTHTPRYVIQRNILERWFSVLNRCSAELAYCYIVLRKKTFCRVKILCEVRCWSEWHLYQDSEGTSMAAVLGISAFVIGPRAENWWSFRLRSCAH